MRNFAFAALVAAAAAQTNEEQTPVNFPQNTASTVTCDGYINEVVQTQEDGAKSAVLWAAWTTTCNDCNFMNRALVQNWAQMPGSETGKYDGFQCTAVWDKGEDFNDNPAVHSFTNVDTLATTPAEWTNGGDINGWWQVVNNDKQTIYATGYSKNSLSTQGCGAWAPIYQADADGNFNGSDTMMTEKYWAMKNGGAITFETGFRVWTDDAREAYVASPTVSATYNFQDLGFVDPNPPAEETDDETDDGDEGESGANALLTAAATALAAFLVL